MEKKDQNKCAVAVIGLVVLIGIGYGLWLKSRHQTEVHTPPTIEKVEPKVGVKTCGIMGDSIAVMLANSKTLPACKVVICKPMNDANKCTAEGSRDSKWIADHAFETDITIISTLSNDGVDWRTKAGLNKLRDRSWSRRNVLATIAKTKAKTIVLIRPSLKEAGELIDEIAKQDSRIVVVSFVPGGDGIHPRNPRQLGIDIGLAVPALRDIR